MLRLVTVATAWNHIDPIGAPWVAVFLCGLVRAIRQGEGVLRVVASDGGLAHSPTPSVSICDELWAHKDAGLVEAMLAAMIKRPVLESGARVLVGFKPDLYAALLHDLQQRGR